ncbi:hypothetical protein PB2503_00952 [Parvularcula bermudensis HTCC2503]|uniref:Uncharacterized protein n=1 Tax=Parvularcula bermudensis (strain ATCC BAA-594 / HTCC2503 / KCTC 12087) TaxID=314260 RepID=E0TB67_PARBH|nr:hypothetical protein [Parvularcula bermudensis]ADM08271.1 hypothetical protein PB2503_00952 [Parvularcula bermudensis HTCC2503]
MSTPASQDPASDDALSADGAPPPHETVIPLTAPERSWSTAPLAEEAEGPHGAPWTGASRRLWTSAKITAIGLVLLFLIGWPLGTALAHFQATGLWRLRLGSTISTLPWLLTVSILVLALGYAGAIALRLERAASRLTAGIARGGDDIGAAARHQVTALNDEIDRALARLADAERLIRHQVAAIDNAGAAIEKGAAAGTQKLSEEREALLALAEDMNATADQVAEKIAEKTQAANEAQSASSAQWQAQERELDQQIKRLEAISTESYARFEALADAMEEQRATDAAAQQEGRAAETERRHAVVESHVDKIAAAQTALKEQSSRLEELIAEQRARADRLAAAISAHAERLGTVDLPPSPETTPDTDQGWAPRAKSWKAILTGVKAQQEMPSESLSLPPPPSAPLALETEEPAPPAAPSPPQDDPAPVAADLLERCLLRAQNYSLALQTQLFGSPSKDDLRRFEKGERHLFAKMLNARDKTLLKARITAELDSNNVFRGRSLAFLRDFSLLVEALPEAAGNPDIVESYLNTPLGQLYVLIGSLLDARRGGANGLGDEVERPGDDVV